MSLTISLNPYKWMRAGGMLTYEACLLWSTSMKFILGIPYLLKSKMSVFFPLINMVDLNIKLGKGVRELHQLWVNCGSGPDSDQQQLQAPCLYLPCTASAPHYLFLPPPHLLLGATQLKIGLGSLPDTKHMETLLPDQSAALTLLHGPARAKLPHVVLWEGTEPEHSIVGKKRKWFQETEGKWAQTVGT